MIKNSMPHPANPSQLDAEALYAVLLQQVQSGLAGIPNVAIVGIHSGGAWLAERLARDLNLLDRLGVLDVSFYRDDFAQKGLHADVKPTQISFDVAGATILLVDDVLYTGRTTRAAINELFDYGRPAKIMLAALVDRGERQLPVAADFVAAFTAVPPGQALVLKQADDGHVGDARQAALHVLQQDRVQGLGVELGRIRRMRHRVLNHSGWEAKVRLIIRVEILLQDNGGGAVVDDFTALGGDNGRGITLIDQFHRQVEAAMHLVGETAATRAHLVLGAIRMTGQAYHDAARAPLLDQAIDGGKLRLIRRGRDHAERLGLANHGIADGHADAFQAEIEGQDGVDGVTRHSIFP